MVKGNCIKSYDAVYATCMLMSEHTFYFVQYNKLRLGDISHSYWFNSEVVFAYKFARWTSDIQLARQPLYIEKT
jgi:hypothetical protein